MNRYCPRHGVVPTTHNCGRWAHGSNRAWRKLRAHILNRDNNTCWCGQPATEVHHTKPGHTRLATPDELRAVCHTHNPRGG